jgi:SAM-dependent methyltransferase
MLLKKTKYWIRRITELPFDLLFPERVKDVRELAYWKDVAAKEGKLNNGHYSYFYTSFFGLAPDFYSADMASERIGLDPLVDEYLKLGADKHKMNYVAAPSEKIPFADQYFDVVCSFNSLDHVADYKATASEIKRIVKPGGLFLMIVEANHPSVPHEPICLSWSAMEDDFSDVFDVESIRRYEIGNHDIYGQLRREDRFDETNTKNRPGILTAKLVKRG